MTQEETIEYNKRCAELLGYTLRPNDCYNGDDKLVAKLSYVTSEELKFHSDWDWIMEVVETIEKLGETSTRYGTLVDITTTHIQIGKIVIDLKLNPMIKKEAVVQAIDKFLIWYNKNNN